MVNKILSFVFICFIFSCENKKDDFEKKYFDLEGFLQKQEDDNDFEEFNSQMNELSAFISMIIFMTTTNMWPKYQRNMKNRMANTQATIIIDTIYMYI